MKKTWAITLSAGAAAMLAGCNSSDAPHKDVMDEEAFEQSQRVRELMAVDVQPTTEIYWNSSGYVIDEDGEVDLTPTTEEGWNATLESTRRLQKLGELLQTPSYAEGRGDDWIVFSKSLVEISKRAEQTAIDRDSDAIFEVGGIIYRVCTSCHQAYPAEQPVDLAPKAIEDAAPDKIPAVE